MQQHDLGMSDDGLYSVVIDGQDYTVDATEESLALREAMTFSETEPETCYSMVCDHIMQRFKMERRPSLGMAQRYVTALDEVLATLKKSTLITPESGSTSDSIQSDGQPGDGKDTSGT